MLFLSKTYLSSAVLVALAVGVSVNAIPATAAHQNKAGPTAMAKLRAREDDNNDECVSTVGDNGELAPSGTACGLPEETGRPSMRDGDEESSSEVVTITISSIETSTVIDISTTTALAITTVMTPPPAPSLVLDIPEEYQLNEYLSLWTGGPKSDDFAQVPVEPENYQNHSSWKELSAVADLLLHHDFRWIPQVVFGCPPQFYSDKNPYANYKPAPVRVNQEREALIPLNLFPASDNPLVINVSLTAKECDNRNAGALWIQAIGKAFNTSSVRARLESNSLYSSSMYEELPEMEHSGPRKTMAILEMLTGYSVESKFKSDYSGKDDLFKDLTESSAKPGSGTGLGVDAHPTIVFDEDKAMRPLITDPTPDSYRLLDCRMGGSMNTTWQHVRYADAGPGHLYYGRPEAYDRIRTTEDVWKNMTWIVRLADNQELNLDNAIQKLRPARATFDSYYYINYEDFVGGPTQNLVGSNGPSPSGASLV